LLHLDDSWLTMQVVLSQQASLTAQDHVDASFLSSAASPDACISHTGDNFNQTTGNDVKEVTSLPLGVDG